MDIDTPETPVSIHTPIQGVTEVTPEKVINQDVSIHTPIQGVTYDFYLECCYFAVSIHTPIQGVTRRSVGRRFRQAVSIHTPIQGVTWQPILSRASSSCFNPHTHTGCDLITIAYIKRITSFNPHTHTGCDAHILLTNRFSLVSIHTPIQGVTRHQEQPLP